MNNQAEQELKEQSNKAAKIMEKQEKPIDKYKNEKLKALLSLYAKPMVSHHFRGFFRSLFCGLFRSLFDLRFRLFNEWLMTIIKKPSFKNDITKVLFLNALMQLDRWELLEASSIFSFLGSWVWLYLFTMTI